MIASARSGTFSAMRRTFPQPVKSFCSTQLVQPCGRGAGDGLLHARGVRGVLPLRAGVRAHAGPLRDQIAEVLVLDHGRGAIHAVSRPDSRPAEAVETEPDGPGIAPALGSLHEGKGSDAGAFTHSGGAMVGRAGRRQEARAAQLHRSSVEAVPLRRDAESAHCIAAARASRALLSTSRSRGDAGAGGVLKSVDELSRLQLALWLPRP